MIETPQISQIEACHTAVIPLLIPRSEIRNVMGPGLSELKTTIAEQGIASTGPWFTHHLTLNPDTFDFEICIPVATPVKPSGRVKPGTWPAMKMVRAAYYGDYSALREAWGEFDDWVVSNGHTTGRDLWERYLTGPDSTPKPENWCTELSRQLL